MTRLLLSEELLPNELLSLAWSSVMMTTVRFLTKDAFLPFCLVWMFAGYLCLSLVQRMGITSHNITQPGYLLFLFEPIVSGEYSSCIIHQYSLQCPKPHTRSLFPARCGARLGGLHSALTGELKTGAL